MTNKRREIIEKIYCEIKSQIINILINETESLKKINISDSISKIFGKNNPSDVSIKQIFENCLNNDKESQKLIEGYLYSNIRFLTESLDEEYINSFDFYYKYEYLINNINFPIKYWTDTFETDLAHELTSLITLKELNEMVIEYVKNLLEEVNKLIYDLQSKHLIKNVDNDNLNEILDYRIGIEKFIRMYKNNKNTEEIYNQIGLKYSNDDKQKEVIIKKFNNYINTYNQDVKSIIDFNDYPQIAEMFNETSNPLGEFIVRLIWIQYTLKEHLNYLTTTLSDYKILDGIPSRIINNISNGYNEENNNYDLKSYFTEDMYVKVLENICKKFGLEMKILPNENNFFEKYKLINPTKRFDYDDPDIEKEIETILSMF